MADKKSSKKIVVAGDLIYDNNLVQQPKNPTMHHETSNTTKIFSRYGGAWYLKDLISLTCSGEQNLVIKEPTRIKDINKINQAFQIWSLHKKDKTGKDRVWRISQFLGCQCQTETNSSLYLPDGELSDPDILVLDNPCLGFFDNHYKTLKAFADNGNPKDIILKTSSLSAFTPFLKWLFMKYHKRLTVILSVEALRERGAAISKGLSWDLTIEETMREFNKGLSSLDLAKCKRVIVTYHTEGIASFSGASSGKIPHFEYFLYHPREHEGVFKSSRPGITFGVSSFVTASVVRYMVNPAKYPLFLALDRGLTAARMYHDRGAGKTEQFNTDTSHVEIAKIFHPAENKYDTVFSTAYNYSLFSDPAINKQSHSKSNLLQDFTGRGNEYVVAKAVEIVVRGFKSALNSVPMASYGNYNTADRQEIERINSIRNLIGSYKSNSGDQKPLSIAVFGPPGSGKSFAIKELASELFGKDSKPMEFNLSQLQNEKELHIAFHKVRDRSIRGQIPLVFWDEFDTGDNKWLKNFLAPMQDANFLSESVEFNFGKAIFVFAGGTCPTFKEFTTCKDKNKEKDFKSQKGPDFVSRLRGFVDIKGPNPYANHICNADDKKISHDILLKADPEHFIRRAILLRSIIERNFPDLIDSDKTASVSTAVIKGVLLAEKFLHGSRSLESVVKMSDLVSATYFGISSLPSEDLLGLHVTEDFMKYVNIGQIEMGITEAIAEACHIAWSKQKEKDGYVYGDKRNDDAIKGPLTHHLLIPYKNLPEKDKEGNRKTARLVSPKLYEVGYEIKRLSEVKNDKIINRFPKNKFSHLIRIEHDMWLRDKLINGYAYAETTDDNLRLHRCIERFENIKSKDRVLDEAIVNSLIPVLKENDYVIVEMKKR